MNILERALRAYASNSCDRCPFGKTHCSEAMSKHCRDTFVEGYKKGYEQSKKSHRVSRNDVIREYCRKGGVL